MMTDQIGNQASPASNSYLNNDGIDELTPMTRRKRVSSLSLSDQWAGSLQMTPTTGSTGNLKRIGSSKLSINNGLNAVRVKKTVIDHVRVASYAFAFDIDGVIVKGPETIPEAKEALKLLNGANEYNIKVPYIFVTNGGGRAEQARAEELSKRLDIEVTEDQVIQGHTPMRELVSVYNNVLVIGGVGDACRKVAEKYGFKNVFTPLDVMKWNPSVTPYHNLTEEELAVARDVDFSNTGIDAILVFADSRNWAADQQIILELLLSKSGFMGTVSDSFEEGPALYFAHSDFVWATNYNLSRYGMGALQVSIAALYREHTGKELQVTRFGKPQRGTFKFASKVLSQWRKDVLEEHVEELTTEEGTSDMEEQSPGDPLLNDPSQNMNRNSKPTLLATESESESDSDNEGLTVEKLSKLTLDLPPASTVYFVGDTPESDIRFANSHDESWYSILVKTGVYQEGSIPKYKPKHICENVLEAVKFAIEREHSKELEEWNNSAVDPDAATTQLSPLTLVEETKVVPKKHSAKFEM
ncbi:hypothetical protein PP7435_CHR2-0441 [Komagataella phaffii CBS 7435]|uniref:Phosphatidyl synthase n=2 Tax=Komagataella phaffii TaxID=460519 RepID=C4R1W6_KOMPG|nr:uncharacterized protein PAS_chr2-2_0419 [Komagataella phaffii GS115]AOA63039.1 GQ67_00907T0 [Komagataella phaffii]CAH2447970.1 hypothetical protein BQ9382_C2-2390 [Komagataella phaffii CBS 7435]AOA67275.1 GQ68_00482T0 [Komagataella phaffii GS115]CAY69490.1 Putative protein of unknown function [Komagataella phaffii GS115]CCA38130.1 hypothetical protein PP7435_CHR2-0441 [Komagataella phaffii CBS 7435]